MLQTAEMPMETEQFKRDKLTWLGYLLIGNYGFTMSALGPLMPFLRSELGIDYTTAAYHFSAWALGSLVAGFTGEKVLGKLGKKLTIWTFATGYILGTALLISLHQVALTIASVFLCGVCATFIGQAVNTVNSDRFGTQRVIAMTEMNICASIFCMMAPTAVSFAAKTSYGWRAALLLPIIAYFVQFCVFWKTPVPEKRQDGGIEVQKSGGLPLAYWVYWTMIMLMVASEWSLIFWSAEFLQNVAKLSKADASQAVAAFLTAMLLGRIGGTVLTRRMSSYKLLLCACAIAIGGFAMFWLAQNAWLNILGLFFAGIGIANFYPLTLAAAIGVVPENSALAAARISLGTGSAILFAPLILGMVADKFGIFAAYGIVAVMLMFGPILVVSANAAAKRHENLVSAPALS